MRLDWMPKREEKCSYYILMKREKITGKFLRQTVWQHHQWHWSLLQLYASCFEWHHYFPTPNFCNNNCKHTFKVWKIGH